MGLKSSAILVDEINHSVLDRGIHRTNSEHIRITVCNFMGYILR